MSRNPKEERGPVKDTLKSVPEWWSYPSTPVVDALVEVLKRKQRWSRDGRSLRLLNKHWCGELSRHITEVRPHNSRKLCPHCAASLHKFPHLATLNASKFILGSEKGEAGDVVDVISSLPSLSRLEISKEALERLKWSDMLKLSTIPCIVPLSYSVVSDLERLDALSIDGLTLCGDFKDLVEVKERFPSLKHAKGVVCLTATKPSAQEQESKIEMLKTLNSLEGLELCLAWRNNLSIDFLAQLTCLVSLKLRSSRDVDLELLAQLPHLSVLEMPVTPETLKSRSFARILERISSLSVWPAKYRHRIDFWELAKHPVDLQSLSVTQCGGLDIEDIPNLTKLTALSFKGVLSDRMGFLSSWQMLRKLSLVGIHYNDWKPNSFPLTHETFPELNSLTIEVPSSHELWAQKISGLAKLEVLRFLSRRKRAPKMVLSELEKLSDLRELKLRYFSKEAYADLKESLNLWKRLESLTVDEVEQYHSTLDVAKIKAALQTLVPHLKVDIVMRASP